MSTITSSSNIFGTSDLSYALAASSLSMTMCFTNSDTVTAAGSYHDMLSFNFDTNPTVNLAQSGGDLLSVWQLRGTMTIDDFNRTDTLCLRHCGLTTAQARADVTPIAGSEYSLALPTGGDIVFAHGGPSPVNIYAV